MLMMMGTMLMMKDGDENERWKDEDSKPTKWREKKRVPSKSGDAGEGLV